MSNKTVNYWKCQACSFDENVLTDPKCFVCSTPRTHTINTQQQHNTPKITTDRTTELQTIIDEKKDITENNNDHETNAININNESQDIEEVTDKKSDISFFTELFEVESIRSFIEIEFQQHNDVLSKGKLIKSLLFIYVLSLIDVITDLLLALSVSGLLRNDCIYQLLKYPGHGDAYAVIIIILVWISTIWAIVYTIYGKYYAAYKVMKQHYPVTNIKTYWNSIKYIALNTQLQTSMEHSSKCCNKYQMSKIMAVFLEDGIQIFATLIITQRLGEADIFLLLSFCISVIVWCLTVSEAVFWLCCDIFTKCCICCKRCKHKSVKYCCMCCGVFCTSWISILMILMVFFEPRGGFYVYDNYGFLYGDVEYKFHDIDSNVSDYAIKRNIYFQTEDEFCIDDTLQIYSNEYVDDDDFVWRVWIKNDTKPEIFDHANLTQTLPFICLKVVQKKLRIYFVNRFHVWSYGRVYGGDIDVTKLRNDADADWIETEYELDFAGNNIKILNYPNDFSECHRYQNAPECNYIIAPNVSWSIDYRFSNIMWDCKN
eukprot:772_1